MFCGSSTWHVSSASPQETLAVLGTQKHTVSLGPSQYVLILISITRKQPRSQSQGPREQVLVKLGNLCRII
jgi:hypothetical protein